MSIEKFEICYSGLAPKHSSSLQVEQMIRALSSQAPSDGLLKLKLNLTESVVSGDMRIRSSAGLFEADREGTSLVDVVKNLSVQIEEQLMAWKKSRVF